MPEANRQTESRRGRVELSTVVEKLLAPAEACSA